VSELVKKLDINWVDSSRVHCLRSEYSRARAYARIWGFSKVWQLTLNVKPVYCIEVLSEHFDKLSVQQQDKILLHELAHIPKNFSGALVPHTHRAKGSFHEKLKTMETLYERIK